MNSIVVKIKGFSIQQNIFVINENKEVINQTLSSLDHLPELVVELCKKYNVQKVNIDGSKLFNKKYGKEIEQIGLAKYNESIKVEYI